MASEDLQGALESMLFVSIKPLSIKKCALQLSASIAQVKEALKVLAETYTHSRGVVLIIHADSAQLVTNPKYSEVISSFVKVEHTGDLTRSAVETLSIIAYRGPITKEEIEQIRGVNCSIALRNLSIRGLVECKEDAQTGSTSYTLTFDFMRNVGLSTVEELPEYEHFHKQVFSSL